MLRRITKNNLPEIRKPDDPIKAIIRTYLEAKGLTSDYFHLSPGLHAKYPYPRMAGRAKRLLEECAGNLADAVWSVRNGAYWL